MHCKSANPAPTADMYCRQLRFPQRWYQLQACCRRRISDAVREFPLRWETENDGKQPNGLERQPGIPEMVDAHDGKILILRCPNHRQLEIPPCGKGSRVLRHPLNFCQVQTDSEEAKASYRGECPAAVLKEIKRMFIYYIDREAICQEKYRK